jgi:hypothetical protein
MVFKLAQAAEQTWQRIHHYKLLAAAASMWKVLYFS